MTTMDLIACNANAGTPIAYMDCVIACITSAPTILANREKRPPLMDVPPMTTARIASNSVVSPMLLASDVLAVMEALRIERAGLVGWSDGACTALILASKAPERVAGVFFFACNMDPSGTKEFEFGTLVQRCFNRHVKDYAQLSPTPDQFDEFAGAVGLMQRTQPNYSAEELAQIHVPVVIVHGEA